MPAKNSPVLGFLGLGNMGSAILRGLLDARAWPARRIVVCDVDPAKYERVRKTGVAVAVSPEELARAADLVLLAPKPQDMAAALASVKAGARPDAVFISVAAGISTDYVRRALGRKARVVRVMPNTPAFVGAGAAALSFTRNCGKDDRAAARRIFEAVGTVVEVPEDAMDVVTALSGSGPAYFFYLAECLVKAAVAEGLPEDVAGQLAGQTLFGAGKLLKESGEPAAALRERVTSKGGTTFAALETFRKHRFEEMVARAVHAAARRSKELGQ
jgi:pyrroline-5-carboxylate reductase